MTWSRRWTQDVHIRRSHVRDVRHPIQHLRQIPPKREAVVEPRPVDQDPGFGILLKRRAEIVDEIDARHADPVVDDLPLVIDAGIALRADGISVPRKEGETVFVFAKNEIRCRSHSRKHQLPWFLSLGNPLGRGDVIWIKLTLPFEPQYA